MWVRVRRAVPARRPEPAPWSREVARHRTSIAAVGVALLLMLPTVSLLPAMARTVRPAGGGLVLRSTESIVGHGPVPGRSALLPAVGSVGPAPRGIADTGSGPGAAAFSALGILGRVTIVSLSTFNASLGNDASSASIQLNAFLVFSRAGTVYDYWVQDVMEINTSSRAVYFEDNLWNASSPVHSELDSSAVVGNGTITSTAVGSYYAYVAPSYLPGASRTLSYPQGVQLELNASLDTAGHPTVRVSFEDGVGWTVFDTISFPFAASVADFSGFNVSASSQGPACPRCFGDVELVVGGPYGGNQTALSGTSQVDLSLLRWTGNDYTSVPSAVNYGIATAEGLTNGLVSSWPAPGGCPGAQLTDANAANSVLWSAPQLARVAVSVLTPSGAGSVSVNGTAYPFVGGVVVLWLEPGSYDLTITSGLSSFYRNGLVFVAGEYATLEVGGFPVVFAPVGLPNSTVWSVTLGNRTLLGTGAITFGSPNGTFVFSVAALSQYRSDPSSGYVLVNGTEVDQTIVWRPASPSLWQQVVSVLELGVGPIPLYALLILLAAFAVVAEMLGRRRRRPPPRRSREEPGGFDPDW